MKGYKNKTFLWSLLIVIAGFLVYYNALGNGFVWSDDTLQVVKNPFVHSLQKIPLFFVSGLRNLQKHGMFLDFYYKPLMFTFYAILYTLGGGKAFSFHLFQILLHITNALLVFYVFKRFFSNTLAGFLSLLFLLHTVNEETTAFIANLQDVLFFFFGMLALLVIQHTPVVPWKKITLVCILLLLSLFSKETGILFFLLTGVFLLLFQRQNGEKYTGALILTFGVYTVFRVIASQFYFLSLTPLLYTTLPQRASHMPSIALFYIREFIFPTQIFPITLLPIQLIPLQKILIPLLLTVVFFLCIAGIGMLVWRTEKKYFYHFLFFCFWFVSGLGMHMQLFPLDNLVAKRWFYFPLVGLLGILGFALQRLPLQTKTGKIILFVIGFFLLTFFAFQTKTMNTYWKNTETIKKHTVAF